MKLRASIVSKENMFDKPLATVEVQSDEAEQHGESYRRRIFGRIDSVSEHWDGFLTFWKSLRSEEVEFDGFSYFPMRNLQVDFDHYALFSWANVSGSEIRLILLERFVGTSEDYYELVRSRNESVAQNVSEWDEGRITRNRIRCLQGLPPVDTDHMNAFMGKEAVDTLRPLYIDHVTGLRMRTNTIV